MAHIMGVRATSLAASAAVLSLLAIGGLTMTFVQQQIGASLDGPIIDFFEPPPQDPPLVRQQATPRPITTTDKFADDPLPPIEPLTEIASTETSAFVPTYTPPAILNPRWLRRPRNLAAYYPERALERGIEGEVVLECAVSTQGALACVVASESPANWGFGAAALRISRDYRMEPATRDGQAIEARHRMVVPFEIR